MRNTVIVLILAALLAVWRSLPPSPLPVTAPAEIFSASRALKDVEAIAARPHPVGSADHARVRDYLVRRLTGMGLVPLLQSERTTISEPAGWTVSAPVINIAAVLKGKDSAKPAVLVMSHYDSVPDSPGAADDGAGVAASLEILRALKAGPQLDRDVVILFTDGEEIGLIGAQAFFARNPLAAHVGAVINFEARGDSGLAAMFETGPNNAATVAAWAEKMPRPSANSLSRAIYRNMPNGSDFTLAVRRGLPGINLAFIGGESAYHSPLATPAHLNLGSVQHLGNAGLAGVRAFAAAIPAQTRDAVYFDFLGFFFVQYGVLFGWIGFGLAALAALYAVIVASPASASAWGRGVVATVASIALPVGLLVLCGFFFGNADHFLRLAHVDLLLAGAVLIVCGGVLAGAGLFKKPAAVWQVWLLVSVVLAGIEQALLPEGAFAAVWPTLAAGVIAIVRFKIFRGSDGVKPTLVAMVIALVFVAQAIDAAIGLFTALGVDLPVVTAIAFVNVVPLILLIPGKAVPRIVPVGVALGGLGVFALGALLPLTAKTPAPSLIRYVGDLDSGKAYVVDYLNSGDRWTKQALGAARFAALPWTRGRKYWWSPTSPVAVPKTALSIVRDGNDLVVKAKPAPGAYLLRLSLQADAGLAESRFENRTVAPIAAGTWKDARYYVPMGEAVTWRLKAPRSGRVQVQAQTLYPGWPAAVPALAPFPPNKMVFNNSRATETMTRAVWQP